MNAGLNHFFRFVFLAASVAVTCALAPTVSRAQGTRGAEPGDFDYYVLALSWSPTYCDTHEGGGGGRGRYDRDSGHGHDRYDRNSGYGRDHYDRDSGYGGYGRYHFYDRGNTYDRHDDRRGYSRRRGDSGEQCNSVRPYSFVLHGLWRQYERRGWPEMCQSERRPWVPEETIDRMMDIM